MRGRKKQRNSGKIQRGAPRADVGRGERSWSRLQVNDNLGFLCTTESVGWPTGPRKNKDGGDVRERKNERADEMVKEQGR